MVSFEYYGRGAIVHKSIFLKNFFTKKKKSALSAFLCGQRVDNKMVLCVDHVNIGGV